MPKFWIVWSPQGERPPQKKYADRDLAQRDANRLAGKSPCQEFYVLAAEYRYTSRIETIVDVLR